MINTKHLLKVFSAWTTIVYVICYAGVVLSPPVRQLFMKYSLHANVSLTSDYFGWTYFVSGLVIWNVVAILAVWLFAYLFNTFKE